MKQCTTCRQLKPKTNFYGNRAKPDGLQSECKECGKSRTKRMVCTDCSGEYFIYHRNTKKRKTSRCPACVSAAASIRLIELNKGREKGNVTHPKGYRYIREYDKGTYKFEHRKAMEDILGRELLKGEIVHHVDGDKCNNDTLNLFLTDHKGHVKAHASLDAICYRLVREGKVVFNRETGEYELVF